MIAAPWYLLAAGVILVILGYLAGGMSGTTGQNQPLIDHRMRDEDIVNQLNRQETVPVSAWIAFAGYLLVFISIVWRIARVFA